MNECGIKSLDNFPKLPKLQIVRILLIFILIQLELSTNEINGKDFKSLTDKVPELYKLKIENNKIESLEDLLNLKPLKLTKINILGNPCIDKNTEYRKDLFKKWPELQSIDDEDVEGKVVESTEYGEEESNENDEEGSEESEEGGEEKEGEEDEEGEDDEEMDENEEDEEDNEDNKKNNNKKSKK